MRSIWKGSIAFGLVNVPIKVYSATETHDVSLHQVHDEDKGRIRYKRVCEFGHEVEYADIQRAYDDGDKTVVLTKEDFGQLPSEQSHEIEVLEFVPTEQIDPMILEKSYYLEPDSRSPKAYVLLRETLEQTDRTAVVQYTLRQKTRLGVLRVHDDVLILQGLLWGDEVRAADFPSLDSSVKVSANELKMSSSLVESMSTDFDPDKFTDEYQVQLQQLIDAKLDAGDDVDTAETFGDREESDDDEGGDVIDLMAALRASVDKKRGGGSGSGSGASTKARSGGSSRSSRSTSGSEGGASGDAEGPGESSADRADTAEEPAATKRTATKKTSTGTTKETAAKRTAAKQDSGTAKRTTTRKSTAKSGTAKSGTAKSGTAKSSAKSGTSSTKRTSTKKAS